MVSAFAPLGFGLSLFKASLKLQDLGFRGLEVVYLGCSNSGIQGL